MMGVVVEIFMLNFDVDYDVFFSVDLSAVRTVRRLFY